MISGNPVYLCQQDKIAECIHHPCDHVWCRCLEPDSGITRDVCMRSTSSAYGTFSASRIQLMSVILKFAWELGSFWLQNSSSRDDSNCLAMLPELTKLKITSVRCEHLSTHLVTGDSWEGNLIKHGNELSVTNSNISALIYINTKNCCLSIVLTATDQKLQKSLKRWYYPPSHCLNVNVMLSNMTFLMIFTVFDPSPLTLWINCSF